jgi:leucyl-tRNA synthetase
VSDNFLDSSWYFFRYPSSDRDDVPFDAELTRKWLPVDMYIGGKEHSVLHLMYTRFVTMAFKDMGLIDFEEPFKRFRAHGMIVKDGAKMSKSKGNVVNPDEFLEEYGADTFRTFMMFLGPFQQGGDFRDRGIVGVQRFYERLWRYATETEFEAGEVEEPELVALIHGQVGKVTVSIEELRYNSGVAALMELFNGLVAGERHYRRGIKIMLQLACPFAPFITQELWERLGGEGEVNDAPWPEWDVKLTQGEMVEWVVQVNGRIRDRVELPFDSPQEEVEEVVFARPRTREWITGKAVVKKIFVPNKLINIVVR